MLTSVSITKTVRLSIGLLNTRDKRLVLLIITVQFGLALLDLLGVLLLGTVVALAARGTTGQAVSSSGVGKVIGELPDSVPFLVFLAVIAGIALVTKSILGLFLTRRTFRFLANRQALVSGDLAEQLLSHPLLTVQQRSSQETAVALTGGVSALTLGVLGPAIVVSAEASLLLVLTVGLFLIDPIVCIFSIGFFSGLIFLLHFAFKSWANELGSEQSTAEIDSFVAIQQALQTYREISVAGRRKYFIEQFKSLRWKSARIMADQFILNQIGKYVFEIGLVVGGGLLILILSFSNDIVSALGILTVFLAATARLFPSLLRMQGALINIRTSAGTSEVTLELIENLKCEDLIENFPTVTETQALEFSKLSGGNYTGFSPTIELVRVSFSYPGADSFQLENIDLSIPTNRSVALVGSSGAGKSTLADVILGVLSPTEGIVRLSGETPRESLARFPGAVAYVPQNIALIQGSVRSNVALGIPSDLIDDDLVWEALKRARISNFLTDSREGLSTVVGENGIQLSGGQRQRLGIARALYSRPKLLVLDEATSSLDAETELAVTHTLDDLSGEMTLIAIAHRLATIRHFQEIVHLTNGRLTAQGSFNEVRSQVSDFDRQAKLLGL